MTDVNPTRPEDIAIVVIGYNRLDGLKRLLESLERADYPRSDIPLVISIDASGNEELYEFVRRYEWDYGTKYVNIESKRLGLKAHIFQCARLSRCFKGVILLEDDLYVSKDFYRYTEAALNYYGEDQYVAGIALYQEESNGYINLPFTPIRNESDCYAFQSVCSWGEAWNYRMWSQFEAWLSQWNNDFSSIDMVDRIKGWERAWSKYFYAYIISTGKYFIFPYDSLTTNFNDAGGEHGGGDSTVVQSCLFNGRRNYNFLPFKELVKYDVYQQNECIYECIGLPKESLSIDLYGYKFMEGKIKEYILTTLNLPYKKVRQYGLCLRPMDLNILNCIPGDSIYLYKTEGILKRKYDFSYKAISYFIHGFNFKCLCQYIRQYTIERIKRKLNKR